jgi:hypothetical protein
MVNVTFNSFIGEGNLSTLLFFFVLKQTLGNLFICLGLGFLIFYIIKKSPY